ncbi:NAP domain-containing protein, partial [Salmonella sp. s51228]|uniref:NAP domain-containing protein n=1 Tax=Salmonella sp. s51228 TaxID=3159652 RepID=UPI00397EA6F4
KKAKILQKRLRKRNKKNKGRGQKTTTKTVSQESFFNFFSPPTIPDDISLLEDAQSTAIELDFSIAETLKERIIPRGVLYFTGEILLNEDSSYGDSSNSSSQSDDEFP